MLRRILQRPVYTALAASGCLGAILLVLLVYSVQRFPDSLAALQEVSGRQQVRDRLGRPLSLTFAGEWNHSDVRALHEIPPSLQRAFIVAEDKRFFEHNGVDWRARSHALWQNLRAGRVVRGASTITEQVVRMLHPRPRSVWSRLVEGIEARSLEKRFSKAQILEFYLNQVPYAARRRGVAQAARYYWDRDLTTLSHKESLSLAVAVRAPARLDLRANARAIEPGIERLATQLVHEGTLAEDDLAHIRNEKLSLSEVHLPVHAPHFVRFARQRSAAADDSRPIRSTLDPFIQRKTQEILDSRVCDLSALRVTDGAVLVVDAANAEVLAWVNAAGCNDTTTSDIDAVLAPRQPGSTLKPLLYGLALSKGWSAATMIDDTPLVEPVGAGLHTYRNYSRTHYGPLPVRDALGNSLNIPAIRTIQFTGKPEFLEFLRAAGFHTLQKPAEFYGEGLALGNGEVTLFELTQAYAALASEGVLRPLKVTQDSGDHPSMRRILSPEVASIISDILADPQARRLEFGGDGVLRFPVQTAVKTGTSTDYNDAWAVGYSHNFVVGVWMGNLQRTPMYEVSGARGPALVLRSVFSHLEGLKESRDLAVSPRLRRHTICPLSGLLATPNCPHREELFIPGSAPLQRCAGLHDNLHHHADNMADSSDVHIAISLPSPGLQIAMDPRIPDALEAFPFEVETSGTFDSLEWILDDTPIATTSGSRLRYVWPLSRGAHTLQVRAHSKGAPNTSTSEPVQFFVR